MHCIIITNPDGWRGITAMARDIGREVGGPFRAPHHTVSQIVAVQEVAIAAGGVLYIDDPAEFAPGVCRAIVDTVRAMDPAHRPLVVLGYGGPYSLPGDPSVAAHIADDLDRIANLWTPAIIHHVSIAETQPSTPTHGSKHV